MSVFDPQIHICKFGFELYDYATLNPLQYNILGNLYERELTIEFINRRTEEVVEVVGFNISTPVLQSLLQLLNWEDFERYRDLPEDWAWKFENGHSGYRDGWGYKFWCLSESGAPLLQTYMSCIFSEDKLPPYEKLLKWLRERYSKNTALKEYKMFW